MITSWLSSTNALYLALTLIAAALLAGVFAWRKLPLRARLAASVVRLGVLALLAWAMLAPSITKQVPPSRSLILLAEGAPDELISEAHARAKLLDTRVVSVDESGMVQTQNGEAWPLDLLLRHALMRRSAERAEENSLTPKSVEAWLTLDHSQRAAALMRGANTDIPFHITPFLEREASADADQSLGSSDESENGSASPDHPAGNDDEAIERAREPVLLRAPVAVVPGEPFTVSVATDQLPPDASLEVRLDDQKLDLVRQGDGSMQSLPIRLEAPQANQSGLHELTLSMLVPGAKQSMWKRSLVVTPREGVLVLSKDPTTVETWQALLPWFRVIGVDAAQRELLATALERSRAVILPTNLVTAPPPETLALLNDYASAGGLVLATGPLMQQLRDELVSEDLLNFLPVTFPDPPPPDPEGGTKKEEGEAEVSKVAVMLAIDNSGSTAAHWDDCVSAVESAMSEMDKWDRVGAILFADFPVFVAGTSEVSIPDSHPSRVEQLKQALEENKPDPTNHRQQITDIYSAASKGVSTLKADPSAIKLLVIISDGREDGYDSQGVRFKNADAHQRLSADAKASGIDIITIRFGSGEAQFMNALATNGVVNGNLQKQSFSASGESIPKIVVGRVRHAYQRYADQKEKEEAERKEQADQERERKEQLEREARDEVNMIPGRLRTLVVNNGLRLLGMRSLPPLGLGLAGAQARPRADLIANREVFNQTAFEAMEGLREAALVWQPQGLGGILYFAAPMDNVRAGSWLAQPDQTSQLLESWIRRLARSRLAELYPLASLEIAAGRVLITPTNADTPLQAWGITSGGREEFPLMLKSMDDDRLLATPPVECELVEVRLPPPKDSEGASVGNADQARLLAWATPLAPSVLQSRVTEWMIPRLRSGSLPSGPDEARLLTLPDMRLVWLAVLVSLILLPFERWLRRT